MFITLGTLIRVVICTALLTALAMLTLLSGAGTSTREESPVDDGGEGPVEQTESVVVEAGR